MRAPAIAVIRYLRAAPAFGRRLCALLAVAALAACAAQAPVAGVGAGGGGGAVAPSQPARVVPAGPAMVALLAPFTGPEKAMQVQARDIEAAARLALEGLPAGAMTLTTYDTAADPARAAAAAQKAVADGAALILGPLFAPEAQAVAPVAAGAGIQALAFTPFSGAAGPSLLVLGFTPENEVARVLAYAAQQGRRRIAVVHPQSQYGELAMAEAALTAPQVGAQIVARLPYPRSFQGVQTAIGAGAADLLASGADAVLIPDGAQALDSVASFLTYHDVSSRQVQFLGLAQWREGQHSSGSPLQGGWIATTDPALTDAFAARFRARNGRAPAGVAVLGYDAVVAAGAAAREGSFARETFLRASSFPGAAGAFRFGPDGVVRRALAVMEVTPQGLVVRDPAPSSPAPSS